MDHADHQLIPLQGAAKKVIPCRILQIFKQSLRIFRSNFAITFSVQTDIKLSDIV